MRKRAFTLVEMLVVLGIIILLTGLLWPAVMKARQASRQTACAGNLRQIGQLMLLYAERNDDLVPFGAPAIPNGQGDADSNGTNWKILPTCYPVVDGVPSAGAGALITNGMINQDNSKLLYCPSDSDERLQWKLWRSKFPARGQLFGDKWTDVRISYFWRPTAQLWKHTLLDSPAVRCYTPDIMVRYNDLLNKATFAECAAWPSHGSEGDPRINILKQDGSVRSMSMRRDRKYAPRIPDLPDYVSKPENNTTQSPPSSGTPGPGAEMMVGMWNTFDQQ